MRVIVTGASGFVGRHVLAALVKAGHEAIGLAGPNDESEHARLDICDPVAVSSAVTELSGDAIVHLAGLAFVPDAKEHPLQAIAVNSVGVANVLEAVRSYRDLSSKSMRLIIGGSASEYGSHSEERMPLAERTLLRAMDPYSATKIAAETFAYAWQRAYGIDVVMARLFNAIGPGQSDRFVVASFAHQLAMIAGGAEPVMHVGNVETKRDFLDVRDVADAYVALLERGRSGEVYNICSGHAVAVREILRELITIARVPVEIRDEPELMRASDTPVLFGDPAKIRAQTGWEPHYPLATSLRDIYNDAKARLTAVHQ